MPLYPAPPIHPRRDIKNPMWQEINDLASAYYADKEDLNKRQALYEALTKERYDNRKNPDTRQFEQIPVGSALKQLARIIVRMNLKGDLGSSVADLSDELLQDALVRIDPTTGLPWFRPTVLFGRADQQIEGRYDPEKGAIQTWFSGILRRMLIDVCRHVNTENKYIVNLGIKENDEEYGDKQIPFDRFAEWTLPDEADPLRTKKIEIERILSGQNVRVRQVGMAVALAIWTGETDTEMQLELGLSRDQFRDDKEKALPLLKPLYESWLEEMKMGKG